VKRWTGTLDRDELNRLAKDAGLDLDRICATLRVDRAGWPGCPALRGIVRLVVVQTLGAKLRDEEGLAAPVEEASARLGVTAQAHRRAIMRLRAAARRYLAKQQAPSDKPAPIRVLPRKGRVA
jgi:hypothetical protein